MSILKVLNTRIIKVFMIFIYGPSVFLCPRGGLTLFTQHHSSINRKSEIWSELSWPLHLSLMPLPSSGRRTEQKRAALLWGLWLVKDVVSQGPAMADLSIEGEQQNTDAVTPASLQNSPGPCSDRHGAAPATPHSQRLDRDTPSTRFL